MPRFSVCVEMVFRPLPFVERLEAVARAGYDAFEFWNWQD
ncbi:MAG: hydroxypyruvate isomerase, partial [Proteobacteria bacterium]|nr:hydroxypyruvate isomerase [Pseudomonadota bacterium]